LLDLSKCGFAISNEFSLGFINNLSNDLKFFSGFFSWLRTSNLKLSFVLLVVVIIVIVLVVVVVISTSTTLLFVVVTTAVLVLVVLILLEWLGLQLTQVLTAGHEEIPDMACL